MDYELSHHLSTAMQEDLKDKFEKWISEVPIRLHIDGMDMELEDEAERDGGEINIEIDLGLRDILKRHPGEYDESLHWNLFDDDERRFFENWR